MPNTYLKTFQKLSVFLGGLFLIFQIFKLLKNIASSTQAQRIREVIDQSRYKKLLPYIIAQAKAETGNFTSTLYNGFHNLFGMKNAVIRPQLGVSIPSSEFRRFSSDDESIRDFVLYLDFVGFPSDVANLNEYVRELKNRSYFEEPFTYYLGLMGKYYG